MSRHYLGMGLPVFAFLSVYTSTAHPVCNVHASVSENNPLVTVILERDVPRFVLRPTTRYAGVELSYLLGIEIREMDCPGSRCNQTIWDVVPSVKGPISPSRDLPELPKTIVYGDEFPLLRSVVAVEAIKQNIPYWMSIGVIETSDKSMPAVFVATVSFILTKDVNGKRGVMRYLGPLRTTQPFDISATEIGEETAPSGLTYAGVQMSDALDVVENMLDICVSAHPELSTRSSAAFLSWRQRNADDARRLSNRFNDELLKLYPQATEREQALWQLDEAKREVLQEWRYRILAQGISVCSEYLRQLESTKGDLESVFPGLKIR